MFLMEYHMIYIVEVRTDEQIIGNYRLDKGSLDFHLNLERRIPFDYLDFNKYQCCFLNVSDEEYESNLSLDVKEFHATNFNAYVVENGNREDISMPITVIIKEAL